jgi:serine/threonine protein phosphatase PrpC
MVDTRVVAFSHSVIGASHIKNGQPCQDASLCVKDKAYTFIAVADGHGGERYFRSDIGSRIAVQEAKDAMTNKDVIKALKKAKKGKDRERVIEQLKKSILGYWNTSVYLDEEMNHFTDEELAGVSEKYAVRYWEEREHEDIATAYGSTLIAVLLTDTFTLALQIGDGNCVIVDKDGVFSQPVPACDKCFLNTTTSLCEENAIDTFRHAYIEIPPAAVLIGTDGIDDCFAGAEKLYDFYRVILTSFRDKNEDTAKTELIDYFPRLSDKGSGDDISIGMMVDKELLRTVNLEKPQETEPTQELEPTEEHTEGTP